MNSILIVEDHPEVREPMARILRNEGFKVCSAGNGAEALLAIEQHAPDLVLLDLMLPKVDGLSFLESVRGREQWARLPVIVLTGLEGSAVARARALGASAVMMKAKFTVDDLLRRIRECIDANLAVCAT